ncbi:unnamed protein product [Moneuplotes crassus]|uniref:DUF726 domain-containing protein n=1 Tax=Euplotes crassus TaxID=5936 RepID=A0AAD2DA65_EUPCR|nr:unnamed protein product [Moneuplotes crassus]
MESKEGYRELEETKSPGQEDIEFTMLLVIQAFFDEKLKSSELKKYFDSLNDLVTETDQLIDKEVDLFFSCEETKRDPNEILKGNFVNEDTFTPDAVKRNLGVFRREIAMREMHDKHHEMYNKVCTVLERYIKLQIDLLNKDREEILYFMDENEANVEEINIKLLKEHHPKLAGNLRKEVVNIPEFIIEYARSGLELALHNRDKIFLDFTEVIEEKDDYEDIQDQWYEAIYNISETIYKEELEFWDQTILSEKEKLIDKILSIFLFCQRLVNNREVKELKNFYSEMITWISKHTQWREMEQNNYEKILENNINTIESFHSEEDNPIFMKAKEFDLGDDQDSYQLKYIITHIAMYCTQNVNAKGQFCKGYYNASHVLFFRNFIKAFFPGVMSRKIIRTIEKAMGNFNHQILQFEYQDPLTAIPNIIHRDHDVKNRLIAKSFVNLVEENDDDLDEYLLQAPPRDTFGLKSEEEKQDIINKNFRDKTKALIAFNKVLGQCKDSETLNPKFELLSSESPCNKHVLISIGGLRGETNDLTKQWQKYLKSNKSLTVYAYRWKTKGMIPSMSDYVPSLFSLLDITSLLSKIELAYKVVKVPVDFKNRFLACAEMAKFYGKLLANCLILQFPFVNQSVSLFGFSLGAQVLYSCLEELCARKAHNIVYNVYFIEGAAGCGDNEQLSKVLSVVRGTIYNYYYYGDKSLHAFRGTTGVMPFGLAPILDPNGIKNEETKVKVASLAKGLRIVNIKKTNKELDNPQLKDDFEHNFARVLSKQKV